MLLDLGLDPNGANKRRGDCAEWDAAMKGRPTSSSARGSRARSSRRATMETAQGQSVVAAAGHTWQAVDYAEGLVRVGVQSAVVRPEAACPHPQADGGHMPARQSILSTILSVFVVALCQGTST